MDQVTNSTQVIQLISFFSGQIIGVLQNFIHPIVVSKFEMLTEVSDARMTGHQVFLRAKYAFLIESYRSFGSLHQAANQLQKTGFPRARFSGYDNFFELILGETYLINSNQTLLCFANIF